MAMHPPGRERGIWLVVEDNHIDREIIGRAIRRAGVDVPVEYAKSLGAARQVLERARVRLILLDNTLPDGHGAEFALELSRHEIYREVPVVLVTDWPSPFMFEKAKRAGVREVIGKSDLGPERLASLLSS